jgi:carnitine-CoA ligase
MSLRPTSLRTLPAMLAHHAEKDPDRLFLTDEAGSLSRSEIIDVSRGMQAAFEGLGVGKGDTVALMLDNRREFLESWFGLAFGGAIEVPVKPANVGQRLIHVFNHSQSKLAVVQAEYLPQLEQVADDLTHLEKVVVVGEGDSDRFPTVPYAHLDRDPSAAGATDVTFADPVAVLYTSGSTGPAKGALVSHGHHHMNGYQPCEAFGMSEDDAVFVCLPMDHNMAQGYGVMPAVVSGASVKIVPRFDSGLFWQQVREAQSTILPFVGAMLVLLAKQPPRPGDRDNTLRLGYGIPIPPQLHEPFEERFGMTLVHAYGSTEATIVAWNHGPKKAVGAAGQPFPGYEVEIHDENDVKVDVGEPGEICVRASEPYAMFMEYFREPEQTVKAFRNLWFHSGDRGRFDEQGNLWFVDRMGDVVRRMGENISSYEVEQALMGHPDVNLAAAFGVPSELVEEEVMVAIVRQPGSELSARDLLDWCRERLPKYAVPRFVEFVDELPMTPTGKVEKFVLKRVGVTDTTYDSRSNREDG